MFSSKLPPTSVQIYLNLAFIFEFLPSSFPRQMIEVPVECVLPENDANYHRWICHTWKKSTILSDDGRIPLYQTLILFTQSMILFPEGALPRTSSYVL